MSPLSTPRVIELLAEFAERYGPLELLLVGGLALEAYGHPGRATADIDGEVRGDLDALSEFLRRHGVPSDLGENIGGWSVVAMPPGYRERASVWLQRPKLRVTVLHPTDFVIAKLRRGTEEDLQDAERVARDQGVSSEAIATAAEQAIQASPRDTALFAFRKTVELFCRRLS